MAGALVLLSNSWSGNLLRVRKTGLYTTVGFLLQKQLTEIEIKYKDATLEEIPEDGEGGDFGPEYKNYRWSMKSRPFEMPDLSEVLVSREGGADDTLVSMIRQMTDHIGQSIKEVTVSVFVKSGKRETEYSVTTYFVDYTKKLTPGDKL